MRNSPIIKAIEDGSIDNVKYLIEQCSLSEIGKYIRYTTIHGNVSIASSLWDLMEEKSPKKSYYISFIPNSLYIPTNATYEQWIPRCIFHTVKSGQVDLFKFCLEKATMKHHPDYSTEHLSRSKFYDECISLASIYKHNNIIDYCLGLDLE
jgi:hypothetical protein